MRIIALMMAVLLGVPAAAQDTSIRLANIDWPPYNGKELRKVGAISAVVAELLARGGVKVSYEFFPFNRAVQVGTEDSGFAGYLTEYDSTETRQRCVISAPVGRAPVGFATRRGFPFAYRSPESLVAYRVGVVHGYVNDGAEVDAMIAAGRLQVDRSNSDLQLLRKVAARRNDVGIIDVNVFKFLIGKQHDLSGSLVLSDMILVDQGLHVCFARNPAGRAANAALARVIADADVDALYRRYFEE
jgi:polar amino acid transport system substrate-binding protein